MKNKVYHNHGDDSVVYLNNMDVTINSSSFTDNVASAIYLVNIDLTCVGTTSFANNIADNGGAICMDQIFAIYTNTTNVQFINNSATEYGGAIRINLSYGCSTNLFPFVYFYDDVVLFVNNTDSISGNSLYFYIPTHCKMQTNISDNDSILYTLCQFNYSQPVNDAHPI